MNLFDLLNKAGYEAAPVGSALFPCTLWKEGQPVGFLLPDFALTMVAGREGEQRELNGILGFAVENQGLESVRDEFKLTQYRDTVLTAAYDFEEQRPVYRLYAQDNEQNLTLLDQTDDKEAATRRFAEQSGLLGKEVTLNTPEESRVGRFLGAMQREGYRFAEGSRAEKQRYALFDAKGRPVGYVGLDNKVVLATGDEKTRREIQRIYRDTDPNRPPLPGFFERLREKLSEIGMALKVTFGLQGPRYSMHENHTRVAEVREDHSVAFTDEATEEQMDRINAVIAELEREHQEQEQAQVGPSVSASLPPAPEEKETVFTAAETQALLAVFAAHPQLMAGLSEELQNKLRGPGRPFEGGNKTRNERQGTGRSSQELLAAFQKDFDLLQTLDGFNQADHDQLARQMQQKYGTLDEKELRASLASGRREANSLSGRLSQAQQKAATRNNGKPQPNRGKEMVRQ